jgi:hypothetical protein
LRKKKHQKDFWLRWRGLRGAGTAIANHRGFIAADLFTKKQGFFLL